MARRDADRVQLDFPELIADLIAALRLTGTVGLLEMSDQVVPTFLIGSRGISFGGELPDFSSSQVFSATTINPVANTVLFDTGVLAAGVYDLFWQMSFNGAASPPADVIELQHRNAANAATLAILGGIAVTLNDTMLGASMSLFGYNIALNERIRLMSVGSNITGSVFGMLGLAQRPTP